MSIKGGTDARIRQQDIASVYDRIAPIYDIWGRLTESRARDRAIELAAIEDGQSVLEVAVGTGLAFRRIVIANPNGNNLGIDLSPGMLERARCRMADIPAASYRLTVASAFAIPVRDESIDTLVNNYMFDLIAYDEMPSVIREFRRVLRPGGKLVLVNMTRGERFGSGIYERIYRISPRTMGGCRGVNLTDRLLQEGFGVTSREYFQQMLFPSEVILAQRQDRG